jgi:hypothetical protein
MTSLRRIKRSAVSAAVVLSVSAIGAFVAPSPAQAVSQLGCTYPRVCFYRTQADLNAHKPAASYQDVTSTWQILGASSRGAAFVVNTRNDDTAYIHFTNNSQVCMEPNSGLNAAAYGFADRIRISTSSVC